MSQLPAAGWIRVTWAQGMHPQPDPALLPAALGMPGHPTPRKAPKPEWVRLRAASTPRMAWHRLCPSPSSVSCTHPLCQDWCGQHSSDWGSVHSLPARTGCPHRHPSGVQGYHLSGTSKQLMKATRAELLLLPTAPGNSLPLCQRPVVQGMWHWGICWESSPGLHQSPPNCAFARLCPTAHHPTAVPSSKGRGMLEAGASQAESPCGAGGRAGAITAGSRARNKKYNRSSG